jgi:hypothetical protein
VIGSVLFGMIVQEVIGRDLGETDIGTALIAVPGTLLGLGVVWFLGVREERHAD